MATRTLLSAPPPALRIQGLAKHFGPGCPACEASTGPEAGTSRCGHCGTVTAFRDVTFEVSAGEVLGIVGESGSGKTTLLRCLNLEIEPDAGRVELSPVGELTGLGEIERRRGRTGTAGIEPRRVRTGLAEVERRRLRTESVAMVHQDAIAAGLKLELAGSTNVAERILASGGRRMAPIETRAAELLAGMGVDADRHLDPVAAYSGGMRQRVQLARALVQPPALLLLDEPTTGLDPSVQATLLALLERVVDATKGATVLVSHDLRLVRLLADRVLVIRYGRVVEEGLVDAVLGEPEHPYTRVLVASELQ